MMAAKINNYFKKTKKIRKYNNLVEAAQSTLFLKKLFGTSVFEYKSNLGIIESRFTFLGFVSFLCWYSFFFYCVYNAYCKDQSMLRLLYDTKLKQYGEAYERAATVIYILYAMWKLPFNLNWNTDYVQYNSEIDKVIGSIGVPMDYNKNATIALLISLMHVLVFFSRGLCMFLTIGFLDTVVPFERMFQVAYTDVVAFMISGYYCYSVTILRERFEMINKILKEIEMQKFWEYAFYVRAKPGKANKSLQLQEQFICKKIKTCAKIHCMLYKATKRIIEIFGLALLVTMFFAFNTIVLYMFYFMEATASGLFNDPQRYVYFLIYVFWQAAYAAGIIYIVVYFSESTVQVAAYNSYAAHEIINSDLSPSITKEAMQLSMQLLHQVPSFSTRGITFDYIFLQQGGRSVVTFLVMLLQFVMDA